MKKQPKPKQAKELKYTLENRETGEKVAGVLI
jgi:hypothetical protein